MSPTNTFQALGLNSALLLLCAGCASVLPTETNVAKSKWTSFEAVQADFDKIVPQKTSVDDLKKLGFDPFAQPNIKILNYTDLVQRFLPNASVTKADLPEAIRLALDAKEKAQAYEIDLESLQIKRFGNAFLDVFGFRRKARTTGWNYKALFVVKDEMVVYKLWSGAPSIDKTSDKKKPLGPLQEIDLRMVVPSL